MNIRQTPDKWQQSVRAGTQHVSLLQEGAELEVQTFSFALSNAISSEVIGVASPSTYLFLDRYGTRGKTHSSFLRQKRKSESAFSTFCCSVMKAFSQNNLSPAMPLQGKAG